MRRVILGIVSWLVKWCFVRLANGFVAVLGKLQGSFWIIRLVFWVGDESAAI